MTDVSHRRAPGSLRPVFLGLALLALLAGALYSQRTRWMPLLPGWAAPALAWIDPAAARSAGHDGAAGQSERSQAGRSRVQAVSVALATARSGSLPVTRSTIGQVVPEATATLAARVSGQLAEIAVADGAMVKTGALIARIDDTALRAQIAKDDAQIAKDGAAVDAARATYERTRQLVDKGSATAQAGDDALAALRAAQGTLDIDRATRALDQVALDDTAIRAPFDGRLGQVQVSVGTYLSQGATVVRLTRMSPVKVQFALPEADLGLLRQRLAEGALSVTATPLQAGPGPTTGVSGPVSFIDNLVDAATGTVTVAAEMANDSGVLWPGQTVNVTVAAGQTADMVLVPTVAVMPQVTGDAVFVIGPDGTAQLRPVTVALRRDGTTAIAGGLGAGEMVVIEGQAQLDQGSAVHVRSTDGAPAAPPGDPAAATGKHPRAPDTDQLGASGQPAKGQRS